MILTQFIAYGDDNRGKWLGQDVAIKEYDQKRHSSAKQAANFLKEIEVISSLRHPNIVLYMGVCIS